MAALKESEVDGTGLEITSHPSSNGRTGVAFQMAEPFRLLDLPPELWSKICYMVIVDKTSNSRIHLTELGCNYVAELETRQPSVTRVCKILREETLPIFYSNCGVRVLDLLDTGHVAVMKWLHMIGPANRRHLSEFTLRSDLVDVPRKYCELLEPLVLGIRLVTENPSEEKARYVAFKYRFERTYAITQLKPVGEVV